MVARQEGQLAWAASQVSMQAAWKPWAQRGSTRSWSPSANAARQMAHSLSSSLVLAFREEETETVGSASMAAFSSPLGGWADDLPPELLPPPPAATDTERQAHRATSARPATQMRAQRRDARMTTVSESTEMEMACSSARAESRRGKEAAGDGVSAMAEGRRPAGVRMVALACCSATARPARRRVSVYDHHPLPTSPTPPHPQRSKPSHRTDRMQSKHRIFAEDLLLAAEGEDHFDRVPDSLVLLIFNKLADARSLGRCSAVSRRFNALVPLVDDACLRIDRVIPADAADGGDALGGPRPRVVLSHLLKAMLQAVLKPFAHCDAKSSATAAHKHGQQQHHSPAQVLKNFSSIRNLRMELPVSDVGTDDGVVLKWKAVFGSTLQSCVILGGTKVDRAAAGAGAGAGPHASSAPHADAGDAAAGDDSGSIPESFYTNGGLKLRVVWTISSLIAAATRHYLLREIVKEHPTLEQVALTDANGQGTLSMARDQLKEFRDKPLAAAAAANRTQVPACNMKLRYAPLLELSDGTRIHGATLVVIKPVGDAAGGGGRKELDEFVAGAFDGPFREAVAALSKRRTYLLEMNGF